MKKMMPIIFLLLPFSAMAQTTDSLYTKLNRLEVSQKAAGQNLLMYHKKIDLGTTMSLLGASIITLGIIAEQAAQAEVQTTTSVIGGACLLFAFSQFITAPKFLKQAGLELSGQGIKKTF